MNQTIKSRIEEIKQGKVPEGYEKTSFGIYPCDWEKSLAGGICKFCGGGTPSTKIAKYWNGLTPWISSSDLFEDKLFKINKKRFITKEAIQKSATNLCPQNSILIVSRVVVGKIAVADENICTSQDFTNIIESQINYLYLAFFLKMKISLELEQVQGTSIKGITVNDIKKKVINYPSLSLEQTKIAEILMKWDEMVEIQESYIKALELRKKALMQNLLTPKEGWKPFKLKNIFAECSKKVGSLNVEPVAIGVYGLRKRSEIFSKELSDNYSQNKMLSKNQICFGIGTNSIVYDIVLEDMQFCVSPAYKVCSIRNVNPIFVKYILDVNKNFLSKKHLIIAARQGKSVDFKGLFNEYLYFPEYYMQQHIANILSTADSEIQLQKQKLNKINKQRKSLQQLLLTGIVRVNYA